jgi:peroxiredoxin
MDPVEKLREFKASLKAQFPFVSDPKGELVAKFDVKMPVISLAKRFTFVIGEGRKILKVDSGSDAIDPNAAIVSCPLHGHKK